MLDAQNRGILDRARALRGLADKVDLIVLHIHPYDVVPLLAFGDHLLRPPTLLVNHADHVFWLGLDASDVIAHIRPSGVIFSRERRGLSPDRSALLPLPLLPWGKTISRVAARERLDISDRAYVLLTVANSQKYEVGLGSSMVDLLGPVLDRLPDSLLIAVGPRQEGAWAAAGQRYPGRVRAVGIQDDTSAYLAAADVYLDSFPTTSLTSMLEAGQQGLPLLRLDPSEVTGASPLDPDDPALQEVLVTVSDVESYRAVIVSWLREPDERDRLGRITKRSVENHHCGEHWQRRVDAAYAQATKISGSGGSLLEPPQLCTDYDLALVDMLSRGAVDLYFVRRLFDHCALLSPRRAVMMAVRFLIAIRDDLPSAVAHRQRIWSWLRREVGRRAGPVAGSWQRRAG